MTTAGYDCITCLENSENFIRGLEKLSPYLIPSLLSIVRKQKFLSKSSPTYQGQLPRISSSRSRLLPGQTYGKLSLLGPMAKETKSS